MKSIDRPYLNFTLAVCAVVALFLISQNWKNQLVLRDVKVYDASILTDNEVRSLADVRLGTPLYGLSLSTISHRVKQNPFVKGAVVVRALPYDLTITVQEREPLALLAMPGSMLSVDEDGIVLPLPLERKNDVPVITNITDQLSVGDTVKGACMDAVNLLADAQRAGTAVSASIAEVRLSSGSGEQGGNLVVFTTVTSLPVIIGNGSFERKILYLQKFLTEIANAGDADYSYVDLRFDGQIVLGTQTGNDLAGSSSAAVRASEKVN